ncbi:MAG: FG-GAP-like repeat-containing protein [Planctomycetes bacterium]|nr:FG-GAP-like repeat-containing protein [Planctomycetota bacterium]
MFRIPTLADLNGDGLPEILCGTSNTFHVYHEDGTAMDGWPFSVNNLNVYRWSQPLAGDVDGDGDAEVVFLARDHGADAIYVLDNTGSVLPGWPFVFQYPNGYSIALADLDGDGALEVVFAEESVTCVEAKVYAYHGSGDPVEGWPVLLDIDSIVQYPDVDDCYLGKVAAGDLEFDGCDEVVIGTRLYNGSYPISSPVFVLDGDGCYREGWPVVPPGGGMHEAGIVDTDGDFSCEVFGCNNNSWLFVRHADGSVALPTMHTPGSTDKPVCADMDGDGLVEFIVPAKRLHIYEQNIAYEVEIAASEEGIYERYKGGPAVGDLDGDGLMEIVVESKAEGTSTRYMHVFNHELEELEGWPKELSPDQADSNYNRVALGDIDGDGDLEIVYSDGGTLHVWDAENTGGGPPKVEWGMAFHSEGGGSFYHATALPTPVYVRGDVDLDGSAALPDVFLLLEYLFGEAELACIPPCDLDGDSHVTIVDTILLMQFLFLDGLPPAPPYPECGSAPAPEELMCTQFVCE